MMKIQLFSLLIIIILTNCTGIRFSSIDDGACASNTKYTFKITGQSDEEVSANIATTITFETPVSPTYSCTNSAIGTANDNTPFVLQALSALKWSLELSQKDAENLQERLAEA